MFKYKFDINGVAQTLTNRVYRNGITMMVNIDKSENKNESINPDLIEDLEADYLLSCLELENTLTSQLLQNNKEPWSSFRETYSNLKDEEKPLFRGVVRNMKETSSNILSEMANPFETLTFPPYAQPITPPDYFDKDMWQEIFNETEKMEVAGKDIVGNLADGAACVGGAIVAVAGGAATVATGTVVAAGAAAFAGGYHIGQAVNEYMGWDG